MTREEIYNLIFAILFILLGKVGDNMDNNPLNYKCPPNCDIDHTHLPIKDEHEKYNNLYIVNNDSLLAIHNSR